MNQFPRDQYDDGSGLDSSWSGQQQWQQPQQWDQPQFDFNNEQQIVPATQEIPINDTAIPNTTTGETTITAAASRRQQQRLPPFSFITNPTINQFLMQINPDLFISKLFYFFFYSAFGSLFPLMAVYFKQLGMNPIQAGILVGIRPFVEFIAAPFWSSIADRFHKSKAILLFSLSCWIIFTFAMAFIRPPASACVIFNETHHILYTPYSNNVNDMMLDQDEFSTNLPPNSNNNANGNNDETSTLWPTDENNGGNVAAVTTSGNNLIPNASVLSTSVNEFDQLLLFNENYLDQIENRFKRDTMWSNAKHKLPPNHIVGKSPLTVEYTLNYNQEKHISYLSPPFSTVVYKLEDVKEVFFLLFLLVVLGEFFSAPAITLADRATLDYLGEDTDKYGQQRMYGSFGWGITMLLVGIALDNSTKFKDHPCGPHSGERNYVTCFSVFAFLMSCAFLIATKFNFEETPEYSNEIQLNSYDDNEQHPTTTITTSSSSQQPSGTTGGPKPWQNTAPAINTPKEFQEKKLLNKKTGQEFIDRWKSSVFAQRTRTLPSWVGVLRSMNNSRKISFLLVTWFMGFGVGLVFTFLFWHLQDLGGTPTLYGYASVINHISEIGAYFFSINLIQRFGPTKVLCIGLLGNACRFIYISWLDNPWWVLPFELIQGVTHATVWAAACSYVMQNTDVELRQSAQGVMQGIYQGLGRGSGSILGGMLINRFGSRITFFLYGLFCAAVLALFVHLNYYRGKNEGYKFEEEIHEDTIVINDSSALAPHGVPTNPIARSHSRQNIQANNNTNEQQQQQKIGITLNPNDPNNNIQPNDWNPNTLWN